MMRNATSLLASVLVFSAMTGCKDDHSHSPDKSNPPTQAAAGGDEHANAISIGEVTQNGLTFKAKQSEPVKAGGEGAFDLAVSGFAEGQKPKAVRFWIGLESGKDAVRALAEEEKPGVWHSHVEVPQPLPEDAKFWAEVEPAAGAPFKISFDFKK